MGDRPADHAIASVEADGHHVLLRTVSEHLFRHKVISLLRDEDLLTAERIEFLMSWTHSGFSAHIAVTEPGAAERRRLRRSWALSLRRIYEVDPLVVRKILDDVAKRPDRTRAPPAAAGVATAALNRP